ncbi:MAG: archaellin/type IV pilin N-terminal domain-containing protein [Nanoarchaeota archaeon]|nr:hypothetical protein [Nanoarchaeota archaeon]MBU1030220.1 hypothetical protein [Nanoarchaeota archaeon]MBU1849126.1 hypothetical protein [Nanoarchaeota archaeon]
MNKRGMSPIIATILLIAFAVAIGAMIMNWSSGIGDEEADCTTIPEMINDDFFCKIENTLVPRIMHETETTLCKERSVNLDLISNC